MHHFRIALLRQDIEESFRYGWEYVTKKRRVELISDKIRDLLGNMVTVKQGTYQVGSLDLTIYAACFRQ